jgi:hypothetical protein
VFNKYIGYALDFIGRELGYKECIVLLDDYDPEDKKHGLCRSVFDYLNMDTTDRGKNPVFFQSIEKNTGWGIPMMGTKIPLSMYIKLCTKVGTSGIQV